MSKQRPEQLERSSDRRLFADGVVWHWGEWFFTTEWIAHEGLALPGEWTSYAVERDEADPKIKHLKRYIKVAGASREPVRFNPPRPYLRNWTYQSIKGRAPLSVNADVRAFFEALTPGSRWYLGRTEMRYKGQPVLGPQLARVHPELGVRFVVAACDPSLRND